MAKKTNPAKKPAAKTAEFRAAAAQGKRLIIAEKPSVANDIARTLGGFHQDHSLITLGLRSKF